MVIFFLFRYINLNLFYLYILFFNKMVKIVVKSKCFFLIINFFYLFNYI